MYTIIVLPATIILDIKMTDGKKTYYHHTTKDGAAQIIQSGYIKQSTDTKTDAAYGPGTYLTRMGPDKSQIDIARNNYDGCDQFADEMLRAGKTDVTIAIDLASNQVTRAKSDRDIHVSPGDVTIKDKNPRVYVRGEDGKARKYKLK